MNRLYQWLHERATFFRAESREGDGRRMVRTEVTVEEEERTVMLSVSTVGGVCLCPLCGNPVTLEHTQVHEVCPGPEQVMETKDPRMGKPGETRRLR